jgi:hypothetical protein
LFQIIAASSGLGVRGDIIAAFGLRDDFFADFCDAFVVFLGAAFLAAFLATFFVVFFTAFAIFLI